MTAAGAALQRGVGKRAATRSKRPDFRGLVGEAAWFDLPAAVRARFGADTHADPILYPGQMDVRMNWLGWLFAQGCRLIGCPLTPWRGSAVPVAVAVRSEPDGAIVWERAYDFPGHRRLTIASKKLAAADGSLLEVARGGLGMRLALSVESGALVFRSIGYIWRIGVLQLPIPSILTPGRATVTHHDLGGGRFHFGLSFIHPLAGETLVNAGEFRDPP